MCGPGGVRQLISEEGPVSNNTIRSDTILRIELCSVQCAEGTIDKFGMRLIGLLPNSADPWPRRRASPVCEMRAGAARTAPLARPELWFGTNGSFGDRMVVYH